MGLRRATCLTIVTHWNSGMVGSIKTAQETFGIVDLSPETVNILLLQYSLSKMALRMAICLITTLLPRHNNI
jgi:hypothetical protein